MKNKFLITIGLVLGLGFAASAQTTNVNNVKEPATAQSFFTSVTGYFTSFDTNSTTFETERGEVWTAIDQNPNNLAAILGLTYDLTPSWNTEAVFRNASVAGTLVSAQAGFSYAIVHYDTKLAVGVDGGSRFDDGNRAFSEFYLDARKALTPNTYAGLRLYYDQEFSGPNTGSHAPGVMIITGFKF